MLGRESVTTPSGPVQTPCLGDKCVLKWGECIAGSKLIRVQCVSLGRAAALSRGSFHLAASSQGCKMPFDPSFQTSS